MTFCERRDLSEIWHPLPVADICERMIGFSVPKDGTVLVVSYEGMHLVRLGTHATVETDNTYCDYDVYDPATGICRYRDQDWEIIGLHPGRPKLESPQGERLLLDEAAETVSVFSGDEQVWSSPFENASGDWVAATFSPDGQFIVLGCPYGFDFRVWQRLRGTNL